MRVRGLGRQVSGFRVRSGPLRSTPAAPQTPAYSGGSEHSGEPEHSGVGFGVPGVGV